MFIFLAIFVISYSLIWHLIYLKFKRKDIADIGWGLSFVLLAILSLLIFETDPNFLQIITTSMVSLWGIRLTSYIFIRNKSKKEDKRYKKLSKTFAKTNLQTYLKIFLLQAVLATIVSIPVIFNNYDPKIEFQPFHLLFIFVWFGGFLLESISDYQLFRFKKIAKNKGKIMQSRLRGFVRYPHYLGEILMWWSIFLMVVNLDYLKTLLYCIGPILITVIVTKISGIKMTEEALKNNKEYQEYKKKVPALIPFSK